MREKGGHTQEPARAQNGSEGFGQMGRVTGSMDWVVRNPGGSQAQEN